jgi:tetratricopeptide (TPR) repeat protein
MITFENIYDDEWCFNDELINFSTHEELEQAIDYWHSGNLELAEKQLKSIISNNPYHIDAYHHLSIIYEENSMELEAYLYCREATRIGLSIIPKEFSWKTSGLNWGHLDNRPFLRAYHNLGLWLERRKEIDQAIEIFANILSVCPNDNLGVRYILPKLWLCMGDLLSVIRHCKNHSDDCSPELMYTYPLALVLIGEVEKARPLLIKAKSQFPLVTKELIKKRHTRTKSAVYGCITIGGADQAYEYWSEYGAYWSNSPQAMLLLSSL